MKSTITGRQRNIVFTEQIIHWCIYININKENKIIITLVAYSSYNISRSYHEHFPCTLYDQVYRPTLLPIILNFLSHVHLLFSVQSPLS